MRWPRTPRAARYRPRHDKPRKLAYVVIVLHSNRFAPKTARGFATMARCASPARHLVAFCVVASHALASADLAD
ncbi:hypothetical protein BTO02_14110 [Paraburkholderia sp. SOS3]|nr:hypothetical protein BTO02_14110 [Paraburkholderia sp. SOS3]